MAGTREQYIYGHKRQAVQCSFVKKDGVRCKKWAIKGGTVCNSHGGNLPQVQAKAKERWDRNKARVHVTKEMEKMKERGLLETDGEGLHPLEHLLEELYHSAGVVAVLGRMVGELEDVTQYGEGGRDQHVIYRMWSEERDRHVRFAAMALKAGVQERQIQIAEKQAELIAGAIRNILRELGVDQDPRAPDIVRKQLMMLSSRGELNA